MHTQRQNGRPTPRIRRLRGPVVCFNGFVAVKSMKTVVVDVEMPFLSISRCVGFAHVGRLALNPNPGAGESVSGFCVCVPRRDNIISFSPILSPFLLFLSVKLNDSIRSIARVDRLIPLCCYQNDPIDLRLSERRLLC